MFGGSDYNTVAFFYAGSTGGDYKFSATDDRSNKNILFKPEAFISKGYIESGKITACPEFHDLGPVVRDVVELTYLVFGIAHFIVTDETDHLKG